MARHFRPNYLEIRIAEFRAGFGQRAFDIAQRLNGLRVGVAFADDAALRIRRRRSRDVNMIADANRSRIPNDRLSRRPARNILSPHSRSPWMR